MELEVDKSVLSAPLFKTTTLTHVLKQIKERDASVGNFPKQIRNVAQFRTVMYMIVAEAAKSPNFLANTIKRLRGQRVAPFTQQYMKLVAPGLQLQLKERLGSSAKAFHAVAQTLETMAAMEQNPEESLSFYRMFVTAVQKAKSATAVTTESTDPMVESVLNRADSLLLESDTLEESSGKPIKYPITISCLMSDHVVTASSHGDLLKKFQKVWQEVDTEQYDAVELLVSSLEAEGYSTAEFESYLDEPYYPHR